MKRTLKEVRDLIGELNENFDKFSAKAKAEGIDKLTSEERDLMRNYSVEIRELHDEETLIMGIEARDSEKATKEARAVGVLGGQVDISKKEAKDFAAVKIGNALRQLAADGKLSGLEAEVDDYARRDAATKNIDVSATGFAMPSTIGKMEERGQTVTGQTTAAGDQGGVYVPTEIAPFIEALWSQSFLGTVGATRFSDLSGIQKFPVQLTKPTAQELTEIQTMASDEITWGSISMSPNRRGTSIPVSRLLLIQGSLDTQSFITRNLQMTLAHKMELDALVELLALTPIALDTNGKALTYADVVALETAVAAADAETSGMNYLTNTKVRGKLKTTEKFSGTNGNPVWENGNQINGYNTAISNYVPSNLTKGTANAVCSALFFGNFSDLYMGLWGGLVFDVERLPKSDQSEITVNGYWDVAVARAASFASYKDVLTA